MKLLPWIAVGGAVGAMARFGVSVVAVQLMGPRLPWGTLVVNVLGSFLLGALLAWSDRTELLDARLQSMLSTGAMGAFTTFSTFSVQTVRLLEGDEPWWAVANVVGNVGLSLLGAAAGIAIVRYVHGS
ncbi:MAG TPA: fluoride efflux transporter CrcB [Deltaproteobacteria bacterium]|nr:fluoride efflux transporter CrcB [Deltaproteobacteria bacterium]